VRVLLECGMRRKPGMLASFVAAILPGFAATAAALPQTTIDVAHADNAFGFRMLRAVQGTVPRGNVVISPVSAALNLSMVLNGADGQTRQEMLGALSLGGLDSATIGEANTQLLETLLTPVPAITLSVANSLWADSRRATLRPAFVEQAQTKYRARVSDLDFANPGSAATINGWASKQTQGKIPKIIDRLEPSALVLLLNAVYFKGQWTKKFDVNSTQQRDFTLAGGGVKHVPRMMQSGRFGYFETPQLQAIRLPFGGGGDLVMQVLLPAKSSSLEALEAALTPEHWADWQAQYRQRQGEIALPRFELKANYRLNGPLQTLGMKRAFQPRGAQLTGMFASSAGQPRTAHFFISSVRQSIYWKVDEEGSEAAAVTSTEVHVTAVQRPQPPFEMIVDRPFFCVIADQRSGALLFVGAIYDPAS
jgi:serine protease inhibitor